MTQLRLYFLGLGLLLAGCSSFSGAPEPISAKDLEAPAICPAKADIEAYFASDPLLRHGLAPDQWRDVKIATCVAVIDRKFGEFLARLRSQRIATSLGGDLTLLTLTGVAAVASEGTANALSAASTGIVGARVAIDKDLYFEQTLPALEAAMETNRSEVLLRIRSQQAGDVPYSLADAVGDIRAYEAAGTIDNAIRGLTATAAKAQATAANKVARLEVVALSKEDGDHQDQMVKFVRELEKANDLKTLQDIVTALKITVTGDQTKPDVLRKAINLAILQRAIEGKSAETFAIMVGIAATKGKVLGG